MMFVRVVNFIAVFVFTIVLISTAHAQQKVSPFALELGYGKDNSKLNGSRVEGNVYVVQLIGGTPTYSIFNR